MIRLHGFCFREKEIDITSRNLAMFLIKTE